MRHSGFSQGPADPFLCFHMLDFYLVSSFATLYRRLILSHITRGWKYVLIPPPPTVGFWKFAFRIAATFGWKLPSNWTCRPPCPTPPSGHATWIPLISLGSAPNPMRSPAVERACPSVADAETTPALEFCDRLFVCVCVCAGWRPVSRMNLTSR